MLAAADVMTTDVITISPETTVRDIATLLHSKRISGVPVVDTAGNILGIVTEGDLVTSSSPGRTRAVRTTQLSRPKHTTFH
jgi:CBS domain-containing protein